MNKRISGTTIGMWMAGCVATLALASCSAFKAYPGPALPDSAVAKLHGYFRYYVAAIDDVAIRTVDGQAPDNFLHQTYEATVSPGRHKFEIEEKTMFLGATASWHCTFGLEVEAGHDYYLVPLTFKIVSTMHTDYGARFKGSRDVEVWFSGRSLGTQSLPLLCWY